MATVERLGEALKKAHAAGDEYAAKKFADAIRAALSTPTPPAPTAEPEDTSLLGYIPETFKAIGAGGAGMIESALTGAAFLLPEEQEQAARARIAEIGGGVQEFLAPDEAYEGTYLDLMRGVGSTLPFLATGFLGAPGIVAGAAMGVGAGAGEAAQRATAAGATEEEISTAAGYGMIPGALEMLPTTRIISRARRALGGNTEEIADALNNSFKSRLARVSEGRLGRVTKAAMEEAAQEASSEVLQNLIAQGVYDPDTGTFEGVGESAKIGGGVGGILQFFTDLIIRRPDRRVGRAEGDESVFEDEPVEAPDSGTTPDLFPETIPVGEEPERLLDVEELAGTTEKAPITVREPEVLDTKALGIPTQAKVTKQVRGKDLTDPAQKQEVFDALSEYVRNPKVKPETRTKVMSVLASPVFQDIEVGAAREAALAEETRREADLERQVDIEDVIAQDVRREEEDIAYTQRAAQVAEEEARAAEDRQRAFELAEQEREEQKAQEEARAIAAQRPDVPTAMGAALQAAETRGRRVPGQAQLEIPTIEPGGPVTEEAVAEEVVVEPEQTPEQREMFGPRGGVLRPTRAASPAMATPEAAPKPETPKFAPFTSQESNKLRPRGDARKQDRGTYSSQELGTYDIVDSEGNVVGEVESSESPFSAVDPKFSGRGTVWTASTVLDGKYTVLGRSQTLADLRNQLKGKAPVRGVGSAPKTTTTTTPAAAPETTTTTTTTTSAAASKKAAPLKEETKANASPRVRARAKKNATTPLGKVQATKINKNNKYTPEGAMKAYLDLANQDIDMALREIAFDAVVPKESTIKSVTARRQSESAREWIKKNMPVLVSELDALTKEATAQETKRVQADLRRSPKRKSDNVAVRKKQEEEELEFIESYVNPREETNNDSLTMEWIDIVKEGVSRTPEEIELDVDKAALREQLNIDIAAFEGDVTQYLRADAVAATMATADASVAEAVNRGSVLNALGAIFKTSNNPKVRSVATALAKAIKTAGGVQITVVEDLTDARGNKIAGIYDESTNTILVNSSVPLSTHVVLHETGHAATAQILNNLSHPTTKALTQLYNTLKDKLPDEYGMTSLKDFVAESFVNPEFQAKLAAFKAKGDPKTAWDKFWEAVGRLFGIETKSASTETIDLINTLLASSPETRKATTIPNALAKGNNAEVVTHLMSGGKDFIKDAPPNTRQEMYGFLNRSEQRVRANFLNGVGLEAITDVLKIKIPEAKEVEKILYKIDGVRVNYTKVYEGLVSDINKAFRFKGNDKSTFNRLVAFSTVNRMDPTIDEDKVKKHWLVYGEYNPATKQYVRKEVKFDTKAKMEVERARLEAKQEAEKISGKEPTILGEIKAIEPTRERIAQYEESKRLYDSLSNDTQRAAYTSLRDFYKDINSEIIAAEESNIDKLELDPDARKTIRDTMFLKRLQTGFIEPYFPLTRTGEYWVEFSYTDDNGQTVYGTGSFDTELQRDRALAKLRDLDEVDTETVRARSLAEIQTKIYDNSIPIPFLTDLRKKIGAIEVKDAAAKKQVDEFLADLVLRALPDQSLLQSRMVRQNFAFFDGDAVGSLQKRGPQFINSLANLSNVVELEAAGRKVREKRDSLPESEALLREAATIVAGTKEETGNMQAFGNLPSYIQFAKNPYLPSYARWLRAGSFIWTLGANISSTVVNASIIPMVLQSRLAGQYGAKRATMSTAAAGALYARSFGKVTRKGLEGEVSELGGFSITNDFSGNPAKEEELAAFKPVINVLKERGMDTRTLSGETSQIDNPVTPWINKLSYWSGFLFSHSERAIRQTSTISIYRLELEDLVAKARGVKEGSVAFKDITPAEVEALGAQAAETAVDTMLWVNTSALLTTAPRIAQTGPGSLIWQFKRVPGQFLYSHLSMIKAIFEDMTGKARTEAEREEARIMRNTFFYLTATGGALVGVKGLPMYGTVIALMNMFLEDDEDDANTIIAKMLGEDLYYGLIAQMAGVDLTDRIALTNLMVRDRGNYKPTSQVEGLIDAWAGPAYGVTTRFGGGIIDLFGDDPKNKERAWESIMPTGISNILKSYRFATEGYETGRGDDIITGTLPAGDVFKQALGFSPISTRAARDKLSLNIRKESGRKERRTKIIDKIVYGLQNNIPEMVSEGYADAREYNTDHPTTMIQVSTISQSMKARATRSATAAITGGAPVERNVLNEILESNREFEEGYD